MPSSRDDQWFPLAAVGLLYFYFMLGAATPSTTQLQGRGSPSSRDNAKRIEDYTNGYFNHFEENMFGNSPPLPLSSNYTDAHNGQGNYTYNPSNNPSDFVPHTPPSSFINQHANNILTRGTRRSAF